MPKKFNGENTKATSAKERKAAKAAKEKEQRDQEAEDALWKDDDRLIMKKNLRKEEKEHKRLQEQQRKQDIKALAEQEESEQNFGSKPAASATKVTRFQLQQQRDREAAAASTSAPVPTHLDAPLVENTNRMEDVVSASGVDEAIRVLCVGSSGPQDGGKPRMGRINMAAAFNAYVAQRLPLVKKDNPTLKLSQLMQRIRKEWQKSPDNPLNQMQS